MKAALIPPKGYFKTAEQSDYHLMLPVADRHYTYMYAYMSDDNYIILDNGAAEGNAISDGDLLSTAVAVGVDEIVVPDVIRSFKGTIDRVHKFFTRTNFDGLHTAAKFMFVVQGQSMSEVLRSIDYYTDRWGTDVVIGLPRHLLTTLDDTHVRGKLVQQVPDDIEIHLLGTNPVWPAEVKWIAEEFPRVRGVDSSLPYNYTAAGMELTVAVPTATVHRPVNYFTEERQLDPGLLEANIATFMGWASGTEGTRS